MHARQLDWPDRLDPAVAHGGESRVLLQLEAERLGRPIPLPLWLKVWVKAAGIFVSHARRERMKRFAAYVLLTQD